MGRKKRVDLQKWEGGKEMVTKKRFLCAAKWAVRKLQST